MQRKYSVLGAGILMLGFLFWLFGSSTVAAIGMILPQFLHAQSDRYFMLVMTGVAELLLVVPLIIYMIITKTSLRALMGNRVNAVQLALAFLLGILLSLALQGVDAVMSELFTLLGAKLPDDSSITPNSVGTLLVGILSIGVSAGLVEEPIFRGVVQRGLGSALNRRAAVVLTAFVFSLIHMEAVGFPTRFIMGLALGYMAWRSGAILPGMVTHAAFNSAAIGFPLLLGALLPDWNGFNLIKSASPDINGMLSWVLISIPFAVAAWGVYRLFALATPASSAWSPRPYAAKTVKFAHWLPMVGVGLAGVAATAVTAFMMWSDQIQKLLNQFMSYYR